VGHRSELPGHAAANAASAAPDPWRARVGIVGAGRRRNGLGPFLAAAVEAAGARVVGVSGRSPEAASFAAAELSVRLGHQVASYSTAHLLAQAVDAMVIASPAAVHDEGLLAALAAGVPCLCEKPLVPVERTTDGLALCAAFGQRGILLAENCQWPFVLPALWELHPGVQAQPVRTVAMGLGPAAAGRSMIEDSLSHVLSVVQALVPFGERARVMDIRQTDAGPAAEANVLSFRMVEGEVSVAVELHLRRCPDQPRPAWLAVNGARIDRRIGPNYELSFVADNKSVCVPDPLGEVVYRFVTLLGPRTQFGPRNRERSPEPVDSLAIRLRCQEGLFDGLR
jgi:NAD(P)-dependent dehydrogenase (short-subunit alcohol dehydrogenase family)